MTVAPNGATKELRISVVVPARNESDEIEAALRSIGRDAVHEILVVDGAEEEAENEESEYVFHKILGFELQLLITTSSFS